MALDVSYHRTFLPDGPFESNCRQNCHGNPRPVSPFDRFEPQFIRPAPTISSLQPFQTADMRVRGKPYYRSQRRRAAFLFVRGSLVPISIVEKIDQKFAEVATPWEHEFSELTKDGVGRFAPVVDLDYMVIGHVGSPKGNEIIKAQGADIVSYQYGSMANYLAADEPVYVSKSRPEGWEWFNPLTPLAIYTVVTSIDGEVISGDITGSMPGAVSVTGPVEYITTAFGVLKLGAALLRGVVRSLVRTRIVSGIVNEIKGPTRRVLEGVMARRAAARAAKAARSAYNPVTGMTPTHHQAFITGAAESELVIVVRHTNPKSIPLIEKGCPGKPKDLEFINTSPQSGIVMANTPLEVVKAQRLGYYVVNPDGRTAARLVKIGDKEVAEQISVKSPFWQLEKGQVIDPKLQKPIVGDYDLMGVINPKNPGQNIGLVTTNYGEVVTDVTNPLVQRAAAAVNKGLDMKRVLHGPQDMYKGFRKGASAFHPDGTVMHFETEDAVKAFYKSVGRETRAGAYPRPSPGTYVEDELAKRHAKLQGASR